MTLTKGLISLSFLGFCLFCALPVYAHKVNVFAFTEGAQIKGQAYFTGGAKAQDSSISLLDAHGQVLQETKTDTEGNFSFPIPPHDNGPWVLLLDAGQGHQAEFELTPNIPEGAVDSLSSSQPVVQAPPTSDVSLSSAELHFVLNTLLEEKLSPIRRDLARLSYQETVGLQDIISGFGYIMGLLGIGLYFKSRKQK